MVTLIQFEKSDFTLFKSWIGSASELLQFACPYFAFPITDQQLEKYITDPKRQIFKITDTATKEIIGHCELNFERNTPRLCRILIAKSSDRNRGYGKSTVNALLKLLFIDGNYGIADLNVYEWNANAIRCYQEVGFRINENISSEVSIGDETWKSLNMQIRKSEWKTNG